jgi:hypothetical protein
VRNRRSGAALAFATAAAALAFAACASHTHFAPRAVDARLDDSMALRGGRVSLRVGPEGRGSNRIGVPPDDSVTVDYAEFSAELRRVFATALSEAGARVEAGADRSIAVSVLHVDFAVAGMAGIRQRFDCAIQARADTSDGLTRGFVGKAGSASYERGCNHAIAKAAREILLDPGIRAFIEAGN